MINFELREDFRLYRFHEFSFFLSFVGAIVPAVKDHTQIFWVEIKLRKVKWDAKVVAFR